MMVWVFFRFQFLASTQGYYGVLCMHSVHHQPYYHRGSNLSPNY